MISSCSVTCATRSVGRAAFIPAAAPYASCAQIERKTRLNGNGFVCVHRSAQRACQLHRDQSLPLSRVCVVLRRFSGVRMGTSRCDRLTAGKKLLTLAQMEGLVANLALVPPAY